MTSSFGSVVIPFPKWLEACQRQTDTKKVNELQKEAMQLFQRLVESTEFMSGDLTLATTSSHNQALSQLIEALGPCLSADGGSTVSKIWAFACLTGALEGCHNTTVNPSLLNLVGNFLLPYCGPIESEDEDKGEELRDQAVVCLAALVKSKMETSSLEILHQRLELAKSGVERRTAVDDDSIQHGYDHDLRGNLSLLPRARRSLCFDLLAAAIHGASTDVVAPQNSTEALTNFVVFCSNCLHGESDPRCLLQLLRTLHLLQFTFEKYYHHSQDFPTLALFDSVAPYYPIQFTPPPNDKHGITREALQMALMNTLSFGNYDIPGNRQGMVCLATGIVLERLIEESHDRLETLRDLQSLLRKGHARLLPPEVMRELSNGLLTTLASVDNKAVAETSSSVISQVATDVEGANTLWHVFVQENLDAEASLLQTPQSPKARVFIAYSASLLASGAPSTRRAVLQTCLSPLIEGMTQEEVVEGDKVAAVYALGALFSSLYTCGAALEQPPNVDLSQLANALLNLGAFQTLLYLLWITPGDIVPKESIIRTLNTTNTSAAVFIELLTMSPSAFESEIHKRMKDSLKTIHDRCRKIQDPAGQLDMKKALSFQQALEQTALIGTAAACRGDIQASDSVMKFLVQLAILGESSDPCDPKKKVVFASSTEIQVRLHAAAASAFGFMISIDAGGTLWKQRVIHMALKEVKDSSSAAIMDNADPAFWGTLSLFGYIVAFSNLSGMSEVSIGMMIKTLIRGAIMLSVSDGKSPRDAELVLAAVVSLMQLLPEKMKGYVSTLVPAALRFLNGNASVGEKVVSLQLLCTVSHRFRNEVSHLKPAVESVLQRMTDHPSSIMRSMVSVTINAWKIT